MSKLIGKTVLFGLLLLALVFGAFKLSLPYIAGASKFRPVSLEFNATDDVKRLIETSFEGIKSPADYHLHALGIDGSNLTYINPEFLHWWNVGKYMRMKVFSHSAKIDDIEGSYKQYMNTVYDIIKHTPPMTYHLFAFDAYHDSSGNMDLAQSDFFIANEVVAKASKEHEQIKPVISIHPARKDAIELLKKWHGQGARLVKWLPNAMNIDPSSPAYTDFYQAVKELDMTLIVHTGDEHAVSSNAQSFGNPLSFKKPLDMGVRIIMAHAASLGDCEDLDNGNQSIACFDLFKRLMNNEQYKDNLYADISSTHFVNRDMDNLIEIIDNEAWHSRLLYGSDYPLPAVNVIVSLSKLAKSGLITKDDVPALRTIYEHNPILFDFVLKRIMRSPNTGRGFSDTVFELREFSN